jgi:hypothetical protein
MAPSLRPNQFTTDNRVKMTTPETMPSSYAEKWADNPGNNPST